MPTKNQLIRHGSQRLLLYPLMILLLLLLPASCWLLWYFQGFDEMLFESISNLVSYLYLLISMIRSQLTGEIEKEEIPLKKHQVNDQVFFVESPKEELGKGKRKEPLELEGVPPTIRGLEDFIIPSPEAPTPATASSSHLPGETSPEAPTPATASSSHLPGEGPLTKNEERSLQKALQHKQEISNLLRNLATKKGEDFAEETNSDLTEAALDWEDCLNPQQLLNIIKSLKFHQQESSFYKRTEDWVKAERQFRKGQ